MGLDAMALVGNVSHRKFNKVKDAFDPRWLEKEEYSDNDWETIILKYRSTGEEMFAIIWLSSGKRFFYVYQRAYKYLKIIAQALYGDFAYEGLKI
jgi:hypothetical protein